MRQIIRSAGAGLLFLPKYSPDLNSIEQVFAKLKHLLRKTAARTVEDLTAAVGRRFWRTATLLAGPMCVADQVVAVP